MKVVNFIIMHLKKWFKDNDIRMYLTRNEEKSVVAGSFYEKEL